MLTPSRPVVVLNGLKEEEELELNAEDTEERRVLFVPRGSGYGKIISHWMVTATMARLTG